MTGSHRGVFTVNELLSDFAVFKRVHSVLFVWFVEFDKKYFSKFFSDKHDLINISIPPDEDHMWKQSDSRAYWLLSSGTIAFQPVFITYGLEDDIKYTLLHEMLHAFIDCAYPGGRKHTDESESFREWSHLLRCPITGTIGPYVGGKTVSVCVECGNTTNRKFRPKVFNS